MNRAGARWTDAHRAINALGVGHRDPSEVRCVEGLDDGDGRFMEGQPVIGGGRRDRAAGARLSDWIPGSLAGGCGYPIRYLLRYAEKGQRMGPIGHDFVRKHFLFTPHLHDYLTMLVTLEPQSSHVRGA